MLYCTYKRNERKCLMSKINIYLVGLFCSHGSNCRCKQGMDDEQLHWFNKRKYGKKRPCCLVVVKEPTMEAAIRRVKETTGELIDTDIFCMASVFDKLLVNEQDFKSRQKERDEKLKIEMQMIREGEC